MQIKKSEFKRLYITMTNREAAEHLGISHTTLIKYAKSLGLSKGKGGSLGRKKKVNLI